MLAALATACRTQAAGTTASTAPTAAAAERSPTELLDEAERTLELERTAEAAALFGRVLAHPDLDDAAARRAYLGLASAHEIAGDCAAAVRAYAAYLERFPDPVDRPIVDANRGACEAELAQWEASARSFGSVAEAPEQLASTRIEARARQGFALFQLDRFDDADVALADADAHFDRAQREQSERFATYYFVGMARFYRAAILHRRFREVEIVLPEAVMAERFQKKLALLTEAQAAYNHTIAAKHMFWVSSAGFHLGQLFGELYDALMHAPVPDWLDERQRHTYYEELKKQLRPIVVKAVWVLEKNLETARRLGYDSEFIARTEADLTRLSRLLDAGDDVLGRPHARLTELERVDPTSAEHVASLDPAAARPSGSGQTDQAARQAGQGGLPREPPDASDASDAADEPSSPADRKLFVPPMTPLAP